LSRKILLVDDDADILDLLVYIVGRTGMTALPAQDPSAAIALFEKETPDLAIVDVTLGVFSGFDLVRDLRSRAGIPIILLTARTSEDDRVLGLEAGADDYVGKPFGHRELIARIRAHLRRGPHLNGAVENRVILRAGPLTLDVAQHAADKEGRVLKLTATEFRLLRCLMDRASTVVPTAALLREVWGYNDPAAREVLRVTLYRLRRKLEDDPTTPRLLHTVPGVGVMLRATAPEEAQLSSEALS
jgi:two-component system, OmpR family, response regulator RegX3